MRLTDRSDRGRQARWSSRAGLVAVVVGLLVLATGVGAASAATLFSDNFEDGDAAGWTTTGGTWIVNHDESRVLHQSSFVANALARTGQPGWRNYTVQADVRPTSFNGLPGFAGVVARANSTTNYYALVIRPNNTVALIRTINGTATSLASAPLQVAAGSTYTLALTVSGQTLTGRVGGVAVSATDGFLLTGLAGLVTTWTSASFDNVVISTDATG
jgi:pectate lyase